MKRKLALALLAALLATAAIAAPPFRVAQNETNNRSPSEKGEGSAFSPPRLTDCHVALIQEAQVPGQEPGVLIELNAIEGQQVKEGEVLAQIDDSQPRIQGRAATAEMMAAKEKASNDVDIRYATKASQVAKKEWEKAVEANNTTRASVSDVEVARLKLTYERGLLEIERAQSEKKIAGFTADAKAAEVDAAKAAMQRRQISSPINGMVVNVYLHRGEWVKPGDAVLKVVQLNRLKVEGKVNIAQFSPDKIIDRPVTVEVILQGRKLQFNGRINHVDPSVALKGDYRIKAEVENRQENGYWLLLPGLKADMVINTQ